ncbi:MAG: hypothetical protein LBD08_03695, partial [Treponema sp.]|nr:hypothetical protein [Treponema sp.]
MAKEKAVYAPGELDKVRGKLGPLNTDEAKRMMKVLGGEVGVERGETPPPPPPARKSSGGRQPVETVMGGGKGGQRGSGSRGGGRSSRRPEKASNPLEEIEQEAAKKVLPPGDNPAVAIRLSYRERVKMDRYASQPKFEIKTSFQVLQSTLSIFKECPDYVNHIFISRRLNEYYRQIEQVVTATRYLFPRNNAQRNDQVKRASAFAFAVLDTIRYWNIERISAEMTRIQAHPRKVKTADLADILRAVYKPLFILEELDLEAHIKEAYKLLYKILYQESPTDMLNKYQEQIRSALSALSLIRRDVRFLLYPLVLKLLSDRWLPYELFFPERRNRLMAFLNVHPEDQISAAGVLKSSQIDIAAAQDKDAKDQTEDAGEKPDDEEKNAKQQAAEHERRAVDRGLHTLEALFPKAGWNRLDSFPDIYPYFLDVFNLKRDYSLIAPADPLLQVMVLLRILEELLYGLRYVSFGALPSADGTSEPISEFLNPMINNWHYYIEQSFEKEYLPRLSEYCRILESTSEARTSSYAKRILNELHWVKRLYFLPYYRFESNAPPTAQKKEATPLYTEVRTLRKCLTVVAAGIEQGTRQGGAEANAACSGIDNPWESYMFQVPNPVSRRLDCLLNAKQRTNASLVFFTLAVTTVVDFLVNNEGSWA